MNFVFLLGALQTIIFSCHGQSKTLDVNVIEQPKVDNVTFICTIQSSTNLTRWTYLLGSTGSSLMSYQNGLCTVLPSDSFLSDSKRYSYTCNSTVFQVTIIYSPNYSSIHNHGFSCKDANHLQATGSTWIIKFYIDNAHVCSYCEPTIQFAVMDVTEGENVTMICTISTGVNYVNWNKGIGSTTAAMGFQNNVCSIASPKSFLDVISQYIYTCNKTVYQVTRLNVHRSEHNDMYMCTPPHQLEGKGSNWIIKVKAPVTSVTIKPANSLVSVKEKTTVELTCTTSTARTAASVYWYIHQNGNSNDITRIIENITTTTDYNDLSVITSTLHFVPTRHHNDMKIYCEANNSVNTSPVKSRKILLNVQYKADNPNILQGSEYHVIENTPGTLSCTVRGGNPTPALSWSCNHFSPTNQSTIDSNGNTTKTLTWIPTKAHEGKCTCTSTQTNFKTETKDVSIVVLYPPSKPIFKVNGISIVGNISFIEGTTRSITCTSDSKPSPDRYTWSGPSDIDLPYQSTLTFNTIEINDDDEYGCSVRNTMNSSDEGNIAGINNSTVNVVVLYAPVALPINIKSILHGKNFTIRCPYTAGMPRETSFVWTRNKDTEQWNGEQLHIIHIEKRDAANYSCHVSNSMKPSGESIVYIGNDTQSFHLDVLYEAIVTSFKIDKIANKTVTKNESDPIQFICNADSNPIANMTISHNNKALKTTTSNIVKHNIYEARCLDAGTYICTAKNMYNEESIVSKEVQLFVNCYPRTANEIHSNITSEKNATITITLNVIAYPPPTFIWYKLVDENWTLLHDNDNFDINSSAVQTNLTIRIVGANDFTRYKVKAENDFGQLEKNYTLSSYDKPNPPINFTHIESHTTTSSIHLVWTPGFDNGPPQTYNIKYKKVSDTVWKYLSVTDNGESTMEIQLTGLTENTHYIFVIFASNVKGNSPELSITATTLKVIEKNTQQSPAPLIGGIAGGVIGCSIIVIVIVLIIRRYPYCKVCSGKLARGKSNKADNTTDEHDYYNTERSEEITNQDNDDKAYNTIESVSEYEMINRTNVESTPYSSLNQRELGSLSAATNDDKKAVYENLKLQVF